MTTHVRFLEKRPHWERTENTFVYRLSFGGPLPPRIDENDLGIESLTVHVGPQSLLFLCPCRAVNGCERHDPQGTTFRPTSAAQLEETIADLEVHARSQSLTGEFGHCLLEGPCSERTFGPFWLITHPHANVPPWEHAARPTSPGSG